MDVIVQQSHSQDLLIYLYKLYQRRSLCDINIESQDGVVFPTHKVVFSSVSTFFHNEITSKPDLGSLKLNIHSNVLQLLIDFSYNGQLFISNHLRQEIEGAASILQMYGVLDLMKEQPSLDDVEVEAMYDEMKPHIDPDIPTTTEENGCVDRSLCDKEADYQGLKMESNNEGAPSQKTEKNLNKDVRKSRRLETKLKTKSYLYEKNKVGMSRRRDMDDGSKVRDGANGERSDSVSQKSKRKAVHLKKDTNGFETSKPKVKLERQSVLQRKTVRECVVLKTSQENKINSKNTQKNAKTRRETIMKSVKESNSCDIRHKKHKSEQKQLKLLSIKCRLCLEVIPSHIPHLWHQHMYKHHRESYLKHMYSRFVVKKSLQCNLGTKFSYWQTGSRIFLSCNSCRKKFLRYSSFFLHFSQDHSFKRQEGWFRFLIGNSITKLGVPKGCKRRNTWGVSVDSSSQSADVSMKKTFKCYLCSKMFASEANVQTHSRKYHVEGKKRQQPSLTDTFQCFVCLRRLLSGSALRKHLQSIHSQTLEEAKRSQYALAESMKCEVNTCQFSSMNLLDLTQHVKNLHPYIGHGCQLCSDTFEVPLMLERHVVIKHTVSKDCRFECTTCSGIFPRAQSLRRHEHFKHGIHHKSVKVYSCSHDGCDFVSSSSSSLKLHQSKHCKEKRFTCEFCGLKLKTKLSHKKHINKMHLGVRPYLCQVCGQSFGEDHELKSHFSYKHSMDKAYKCHMCSYATSVKSTFFTHMFNVHKIRDKDDKRQEYQCTMCPFKSILHHRFKLHVNSHTNTREYWCKICNKSFVSSSTLHAHKQWMHSETVISCTQCDYQTKTRQKLNEHIRIQHQLKGLKPYKCPYCEFRCATGGNTRKHVKQVHPGFEVQYIRDTSMLDAARIARATGHNTPLSFPFKSQQQGEGNACAVVKDMCANEYPKSGLNNPSVMVQ